MRGVPGETPFLYLGDTVDSEQIWDAIYPALAYDATGGNDVSAPFVLVHRDRLIQAIQGLLDEARHEDHLQEG